MFSFRLDPIDLWPGTIPITPGARFEHDGKSSTVWGKAFEIRIAAPVELPGIELPRKQRLGEGWQLQVESQPAQIVKSTDGTWLKDAGLTAGKQGKIEAWFDVTESDLYQLHFQGNVAIQSVKVDDQDQPVRTSGFSIPIALAKGLHRMRIEIRGAEDPKLEIFFGNEGKRRMEGGRFRHLEAAE